MPRGAVAGSEGKSVFSFLRTLHTALHSDYTILHPHQQCRWAPLSPHPVQHLSFVGILTMTVLAGGRVVPHRSLDLHFSSN